MGLAFLFLRLLLAFIFVRAGLAKLANIAGSRQTLRGFAVLLPLAELVVAVALIPTLTAWWAARAACALLLLSVASIGSQLVRGRQPERHNVGQRHTGIGTWLKLGFHLVLAGIVAFMLWQGQYNVGPGVLDWLAPLSMVQRIGLLVAVVLSALLLLVVWVQFHALSQQGRLLLRIEALEVQPTTEDDVEELSAVSLTVAPFSSVFTATSEEGRSTVIAPSTSVELPAMPSTPIQEQSKDIELTIGMAVYNDFDGVYFTLQALQLYQDLEHTELLVIDNYGCDETKKLVERWIKGARYIRATDVTGTAAPRDLVFREARGNAVLCCDCHVLFAPGAIARLKQFYREHPACNDLLQGPLLLDDKKTIATHFEPQWRAQMWGTWGNDPRGQDPNGEPFEIPMQGLGVFSCTKRAWLGFNPEFRGFGGEEGYIHEKFRQAGRHCLCLPWLLWMHRFGRPSGPKYTLTVEEKLRNYVIGHTELGLDLTPVLEHFAEYLSPHQVMTVTEQALGRPWRGTLPTSGQDTSVKDKAPAKKQETRRVIAAPRNSDTVPQSSQPAHSGVPDGDETPLVSIVLPVYNGERYLRVAVESLLGQTLQDIEIIIVNDGSTDQTPSIINDLLQDLRVRAVHQTNKGMAHARRRGIALARAKYLVSHDADDISLPDRLQKEYTFLEENPDCGLIGTYMELIDETGQVFRSPGISPHAAVLEVVMVEPTHLLTRNHFVHGSVMIRKSACEAVGNYRDEFLLADDYDLWLRVAEKYAVGNVAEVLFQYRSHTENISKKKGPLLQAYAEIAKELARERKRTGSDILMREGPAAFWHRYGAQLKAAGLPDVLHEPAVC